MIFSFTYYGRPFSINRYFYAARKVKTKEARAWEAGFLRQLEPRNKDLLQLAEIWRKRGGVFDISIQCKYRDYLNAQGTVSSKTIDITNFEKPLQDLLFTTMGINDKFVQRCQSYKKSGLRDEIDIELKLYPQRE